MTKEKLFNSCSSLGYCSQLAEQCLLCAAAENKHTRFLLNSQ